MNIHAIVAVALAQLLCTAMTHLLLLFAIQASVKRDTHSFITLVDATSIQCMKNAFWIIKKLS